MSIYALDEMRRDAVTFLSQKVPGCDVISVGQKSGVLHMAEEVRQGLGMLHRSIPPTYFYDKTGSDIYEQITRLEEYYPTRTEAALLKQVAPELTRLVGGVQMVELGSGSSTKTRTLLDAWHADTEFLTYVPIDVSEAMLRDTARLLTREYRQLQVLGVAGQYEKALAVLPPNAHRLVLFLGGTIGNFTVNYQAEFFTRLRKLMQPGTKFLLGFDRQPHDRKPVRVIERAYNDDQRVTARFNLNLLAHINHVLDADFDPRNWEHRAIYNEEAHRIEMYLKSLKQQNVRIEALNETYAFSAGEEVLTEISRKFDPDELALWFESFGYRYVTHWSDPAEYFGLMLFENGAR